MFRRDYNRHMIDFHDGYTSRTAERNELAKQILVANIQHNGEASCEEAVNSADKMMFRLYGDDWECLMPDKKHLIKVCEFR